MRKLRPLPSQETLTRLFRYDPETGLIYWNSDGRRAFTTKSATGHYQGRIAGVIYLAHRIIWKMLRNEEPPTIDHINGEPGDNREVNLRAATRSQNSRNQKRRRDASSEFGGVSILPRTGRWRAYCLGRHLGYFSTFEEAKAARIAENVRLGFTERHGLPCK